MDEPKPTPAMIQRVEELHTFQHAWKAAMALFEASKAWPREERYALTDQVRRSSRSVCANMAEAWAKRRYRRHFISKLSDAHGEAEETLVWIRFAVECGYLGVEEGEVIEADCRRVIGGLIKMIRNPNPWCGPSGR